eukprot:scaffold352307_cov76-Cyclotella_meneghiniana.AAC.1
MERDWKTLLDSLVLKSGGIGGDTMYSGGGNSGENNPGFMSGGHVDDFAAELAQEVKAPKKEETDR